MIGMLTGKLSLKTPTNIIINVHGVGYKVFVPPTLFSSLAIDDEVTVFTYTHVREDALELYGFLAPEDLRLFEFLISVSGVGCKSALGVFSRGDRGAIQQAIVTGDVSFFTAVPRLGKKNSQKIIIELKQKLGGIVDLDLSQETTAQQEAVEALKSLGYTQQEAEQAVRVSKEEKAEAIIRDALRSLGK